MLCKQIYDLYWIVNLPNLPTDYIIVFFSFFFMIGTDGEELSKIQKVKLIRNEQREGMLKFSKNILTFINWFKCL